MLSLRAVQAELASAAVTPGQLLEACLGRVGDAFAVVDPAGARRTVAELEAMPPLERAPLWGVPVAVKDLVDVAGLPTGAGRDGGRTATVDAPLVARLRALGAVIIGKTRTDELGLATFTPGVDDPRDPGRSVGGSSGGSAVAVYRGAAVLAVATDTAGSARIPAAACGVAGLCAPRGWFAGGAVGLSDDFDRLGLIAADCRSLADAWAALTPDRGIAASPPARVAVLTPDALGRVDDERQAAVAQAAEAFGVPLTQLSQPRLAAFGRPRGVVVTADAAARHASGEARNPLVRGQLVEGGRQSAQERAQAWTQLETLGRELRDAIGDGVLLVPTVPSPPPRWSDLATVEQQLGALGRLTRLCAPANSSGLVAVTVPWGVDADGRPVAVQVMGAGQRQVLAAACALESHAPVAR